MSAATFLSSLGFSRSTKKAAAHDAPLIDRRMQKAIAAVQNSEIGKPIYLGGNGKTPPKSSWVDKLLRRKTRESSVELMHFAHIAYTGATSDKQRQAADALRLHLTQAQRDAEDLGALIGSRILQTRMQAVIDAFSGAQEASDAQPEPMPAHAALPAPKPKLVACNEFSQESFPEFQSMAQLDQFQLDLQQGTIRRPTHPEVTTLVEQLNRSNGRISVRATDKNAADQLLTFIMRGHKTIHADVQGRTGRQINTFGERTFETRLEAARFLFTETNFLQSLNPTDSAYYKTHYLDLIDEAAKLKVLEAQAQDEENNRVA